MQFLVPFTVAFLGGSLWGTLHGNKRLATWRRVTAGTLLYVTLAVVCLLLSSCATAPHPAIRMLAPSNIGQTVFPPGSIKAETKVGIKVPFVFNGTVRWESVPRDSSTQARRRAK